jgi:hypothetical protein
LSKKSRHPGKLLQLRLNTFLWLVVIAGLCLVVMVQERRFSNEARLWQKQQVLRWMIGEQRKKNKPAHFCRRYPQIRPAINDQAEPIDGK